METLFENIEVVGIGASTLDIFTVVDAFPATREVRKTSAMVIDGGGPVATAMVTLAKLGVRSTMIDNVGDDWAGTLIVDDFKKYLINTSCLNRLPETSSAVSNILVHQGTGMRAILYHPGTVCDDIAITKYTKVIQKAKILHCNGRHFAAAIEAISLAKAAGVKVSFDGGANRYNPLMRQIVPLTDICIVAKDFALQYTGKSDIEEALQELKKEGPQIIGVTDGINGSWILHEKTGLFHQTAFLMGEAVDTTGCGDSYHGAFLYGLLKGMPLKDTARFASAVAAINTRTLGGRRGLPSLAEVQKFLK